MFSGGRVHYDEASEDCPYCNRKTLLGRFFKEHPKPKFITSNEPYSISYGEEHLDHNDYDRFLIITDNEDGEVIEVLFEHLSELTAAITLVSLKLNALKLEEWRRLNKW